MMELKEQTCTLVCDEGLEVTLDMKWSVEALGNILKNCVEHTPQQGSIHISVQDNPLHTCIRIQDSGKAVSYTHLIRKCRKAQSKYEKETAHYNRHEPMIHAMQIAEQLLEEQHQLQQEAEAR